MKILFITAFPPNEKTAGQDYSRRLLLDLIQKGHEISLIYACYPGHPVSISSNIDILLKIKPSILNCVRKPFIHPFFTKRFNVKNLNYIKSIANNYDMLYFDFSQVHLYSKYIEHPNKVLMCHDVIAQKFFRQHILQFPFIKRNEKNILKTSKQILTFSKKDSDFIKKIYKIESKYVNFYLKTKPSQNDNIIIQKNNFCFYGAWNRKENTEGLLWFLSNVYPKLNKDLTFIIIGGGLDKKIIQKLSCFQNIQILGFVDDPISEIASCQALIAPLFEGAGVKVKVIDSLTSGTPVIGTEIAFEGIQDNKIHKLFYNVSTNNDFINVINNWNNIEKEYKIKASTEFYKYYEKNHFPDLI